MTRLSLALLAAAALGFVRAQAPFCGSCPNGGVPPMINWQLIASCTDAGARIASVVFASYGTPTQTGTCAYAAGACNAKNTTAVVAAACIGQYVPCGVCGMRPCVWGWLAAPLSPQARKDMHTLIVMPCVWA